jgi:hypothetical protein
MSCDRLLPARDYHKIISVNTSQHQPGLLLEQVAIQLLASHEADAPLPVFALILERRKLLHGHFNLRAQSALGFEPTLANVRMMKKISDRQA